MADWASEAGHYYDSLTGEPRYRIVGANGIERDTNLGDLKRAVERGERWVPGATTIISQVENYNIREYNRRQMFMAALTLTRQDGESDDDFYKRAKKDADEHKKKAGERGSQIHGAVEAHYAGRPYDETLRPWVESIENLLTQTFGLQEWRSEKSFASNYGFGGKVDLHSKSVLLDFKGRDGAAKFKVYDEQAEQLAAYAVGLDLFKDAPGDIDMLGWPRAGIVFFDRETPYSEFHEVKPAELEVGWQMFLPLVDHWYAKNRLPR